MEKRPTFGEEVARETAMQVLGAARKAAITTAFVAGTAVAGPVGGAIAGAAAVAALNADTIKTIWENSRKES